MDAPDARRKIHAAATPRVGGVAIWITVTAVMTLFQFKIPWSLWWAVSLMGLVGLLDDLFSFHPFVKLGLQGLAGAAIAWAFGKFSVIHSLPGWDVLLLTGLWMVFFTNTLNFTDNSNGLCGGLALILSLGIALVMDFPHIDTFPDGVVLMGALVGFLLLNFPRGHVFLGDSGSHFLGGILGLSLVNICMQGHCLSAVLLSAVPLIDGVQVTLGRIRRHQPIWQADTHHLSHLLSSRGLSRTQSVLVLWGCAAVFALLAVWVRRWG